MRKLMLGMFIGVCMVGSAMSADKSAGKLEKKVEQKVQQLLKSVQEGCNKELTTFCKDVTPGEGRVLACLYAFEDKLSGQCSYALVDAAAQLQQAVTKVVYLANECTDDLKQYCSEVEPGEMRLVNCLNKNKKSLNERCSIALKTALAEK